MKHILYDMGIYKYAFFYNWEGFKLYISGLNKYAMGWYKEGIGST